ncbi:hypothetical protein ACR34G_03520 [Mycoplasma sp. 480]|uniref:hypothetical protein n=1 Tax=Mycoplasma sp. 480 TaxID=3440155 RepID=UPI003F516748
MKKKLLLLATPISVLTTAALAVSCQSSLDKKKEEYIDLTVKLTIKQNKSEYDKKSEAEKKEYEKQQRDGARLALNLFLPNDKSSEWEKLLDSEIARLKQELAK